MDHHTLPVAIIGAGPVGLAALAHLQARGINAVALEQGPTVGTNITQWGHVRFFSPWKYSVDSAARELLLAEGWTAPDPDAFPTGRDLVSRYLQPLASHPALSPSIRYNTRVISVARQGLDRLKSPGRTEAPFELTLHTGDDEESVLLARAVIDASGTWNTPNPLGANGTPALGEQRLSRHIAYGIPDVLIADRDRYAGKRVLVVGSGHSAFNVLIDLVNLAAEVPATSIAWAIRKPAANLGNLFGGGINDALPARGELGARVQELVASGRLQFEPGLQITRLDATPDGIVTHGIDRALAPVDEIIATTGFRPNLAPLSELRLGLDPIVESPAALAPLIDPNLHSCGSVPPHGAEELKHPEPDFYIVGMKSYGRAPTFLMLTGYEQVRSVTAAIAGDWEAARDVHLVLPETGVCSSSVVLGEAGVACCGTAAASSEQACCGDTADTASSCCGDQVPQVISLTSLTRGGCC